MTSSATRVAHEWQRRGSLKRKVDSRALGQMLTRVVFAVCKKALEKGRYSSINFYWERDTPKSFNVHLDNRDEGYKTRRVALPDWKALSNGLSDIGSLTVKVFASSDNRGSAPTAEGEHSEASEGEQDGNITVWVKLPYRNGVMQLPDPIKSKFIEETLGALMHEIQHAVRYQAGIDSFDDIAQLAGTEEYILSKPEIPSWTLNVVNYGRMNKIRDFGEAARRFLTERFEGEASSEAIERIVRKLHEYYQSKRHNSKEVSGPV